MIKKIARVIRRILTKLAVLYILKYATGKSEILDALLVVFFDMIDDI